MPLQGASNLLRALAVCGSLCVAVYPQARSIAGYLGMALLLITALAGIFLTDAVGGDRSAHGRLHELGSTLDQRPFAALFISWRVSRSEAWSSARRLVRLAAFLPLQGLVIFIASSAVMLPRNGGRPGPEGLVGWPNRIMILSLRTNGSGPPQHATSARGS